MNRLVWAASSTFQIGPYYLGVRCNRVETDLLVRELLRDYVVEGVDAPPNFSIVISGGEDRTVATGLNFLYRNHVTLIRSRWPDRVQDGLVSYLSGYIPQGQAEQMRVPAIGLVKDGRAVVAPAVAVNWIDLLTPRLHRLGVQFVDAQYLQIDTETAELVVIEPALKISSRPPALVNGPNPSSREPPPVTSGRYPLSGWAVFAGGGTDVTRLTITEAMINIGPSVMHSAGWGSQRTLDALHRLFTVVPPMALGSPLQGDLAARLARLFD